MRLTVDKYTEYAHELAERVMSSGKCSAELKDLLSKAKAEDQSTQSGIETQRQRVAAMKKMLAGCDCEDCKELLSLADYFIKRSVWGLGGDGWAYDIGYGGLDHVLASGRNINMLVLDTEVYSNTGGQLQSPLPWERWLNSLPAVNR
jgi:pyruvate-ferredoxin/flavodoxin oxidoreductase